VVTHSLRENNLQSSPKKIATNSSVASSFIPYRYYRHILFFFSENATIEFFNRTIFKLFELDEYCGGENLATVAHFGNDISSTKNKQCVLDEFISCCCSIEDNLQFGFLNKPQDTEKFLNETIAQNVSTGTVDQIDVKQLSGTLLYALSMTQDFTAAPPINAQIILITDYVTDSFKRDNLTGVLADFKARKNISFIALTTNLTKTLTDKYFPTDVWTVVADFANWTYNMSNPICGYEAPSYSKIFL
jgi:hypothetical protein